MPPSLDRHILNAAHRLLSYRPRSSDELRRRLSRNFPANEVENTVTLLKERGLVDDVAFAHFWKESRERHRPRGVAMLRSELLRMGVAREIVEETLDGVDEEEGAYRAAQKVVRRLEGMDYNSFRKKVGGYLQRRGFSFSAVKGVVERTWRELADPVNGHEHGDAQGDQSEEVPG